MFRDVCLLSVSLSFAGHFHLGVSNGLCEHLRAVCLFLRAQAVISFVMRAVSTLEITNGEHFPPAGIQLSLLKRQFCAK